MSKRYRFRDVAFVAVAAGLALIDFWAIGALVKQHQDSTARIEQEAQKDRDDAQHATGACAAKSGLDLLVCVDSADAAQREAERSHEDLQAQQDSASASFWAIVLSATQSLLGVGGLYYVARTFRISARATAASALATRAAIRSANAAERAYLADNRPWLEIKAPSIAVRVGDQGTLWAFVEIKVTNLGKTPASHVRVNAEMVDTYRPQKEIADITAFYDRQLALPAFKDAGTSILPGGWIAVGHVINVVDGREFEKVDLRYIELRLCVTYRHLGDGLAQTGHVFTLVECDQPAGFEPPSRFIWEGFAETVTSTWNDRVT